MNKKIILGIIVVVIIAIAGGTYFVKNKKSNQADLSMSEYVAGNYIVKYPPSLTPFYSFCNVGGVNGTDVKIEKIMFWFKDSTPVLPINNECPTKLENSAPIVVNLDDSNIIVTDTTNHKYSEVAKQISIKSTIVNSTSTSTSDWKTYDFTGSPYIESGPISFKYPSDWKLDFAYYTTPGGAKDITSISITSPSGIEQIIFSNGGRQSTLNCDILRKSNTSESRGRLVCKMINRTPFYLTYTTNVNAEEIYNQIINSIK